jgi:hypothetical protein
MKKPTYTAPSRTGKVNIAIWTEPERRLDLKMMAVKTGRSIQEIIETAIDRELAAFRKSEAKKS